MTSDNTTARPWFATKTLMGFGDRDGNRRMIRGNDPKDDHEVCTLNPHMQQWTARHEADLNLMLRAVNAYDDLVEVLQEIEQIARAAEAETLNAPGAPGWTSVCAIAVKARAALVKAGKKPDGR